MLLGLLWSSCSNEEGITPPSKPDGATSELRTIAEAISIADKHFASRAEGARAITRSVKGVSVIGNASGRSASDTLIYAINYEDNAGFALVSAVPHGIDIIGYADEGSFNVEKIEPGSNVEYFLEAAKDYVSTQGKISIGGGDNPFKPIDVHTWKSTIIPRLSVQWGQRYPEGMFCDNYYSGCVQTAMAQMMSYFKLPTSITLTYPGKDVNAQSLNWTELLKHKKSCGNSSFSIDTHHAECSASVETHKALGRLCRELGKRNNANYSNPEVTTAFEGPALATFKSLCPSLKYTEIKYFNSDHSNMYIDMLGKDAVAFVCGYTSQGAFGHAWVCDGGEQETTTAPGYDGSTVTTNKTYYHYNWGLYGQYDGYFANGVFDQSKPSTRGNYNYLPRYFVVYK